jgi:hypothetical protein
MMGFTLLSCSYYYLRRRSPGPPFPPDHRQAGERGAIKRTVNARATMYSPPLAAPAPRLSLSLSLSLSFSLSGPLGRRGLSFRPVT